MSTAPKFVRSNPQVNPDRLAALRKEVSNLRDLTQRKETLEQALEETNAAITLAQTKTLPDMMDEAGVPLLGLPADGNNPAVTAVLQPFYSANIVADWPPEKRAAAFALLTKLDAGDLIKTEVNVAFARENRKAALAFAEEIKKTGLEPSLKEGVHFMTLTAWLKSSIEDGEKFSTDDLSTLGATVGRIVRIKDLKPK